MNKKTIITALLVVVWVAGQGFLGTFRRIRTTQRLKNTIHCRHFAEK